MIPALLAVPVVEGVVGQIVNQFTPQPMPPSFAPHLQGSMAATAPARPSTQAATGALRADQWNQLSASDTQAWLQGLTGRQVTATDLSGRVISGIGGALQHAAQGNTLTIGGHVVSLSQLKQITWSPSAA
jgi:hypothetical protein